MQVNSSGYHFVRLYFPNFAYGAAAVAAFNVYIEGAKVLSDFRVNASLGVAEAEFFVPVLDGRVDIQLEAAGSGLPVLSGVSVLRAPAGMYNLTGTDLILATEYRVGGGFRYPLRDEIGRIWYHDRAYGSPQKVAAWEYDRTRNAHNEATQQYMEYANSLPELIPFLAYMVCCALLPGRELSMKPSFAKWSGDGAPAVKAQRAGSPALPMTGRVHFPLIPQALLLLLVSLPGRPQGDEPGHGG